MLLANSKICSGVHLHASYDCRYDVLGANDFSEPIVLLRAILCTKQVHSAPLDLLLPQTLLTHLMDADGSLSEAGYLVATLEAAVSFITQVLLSVGNGGEDRFCFLRCIYYLYTNMSGQVGLKRRASTCAPIQS